MSIITFTIEIAREKGKDEPDRLRTNTFLELFEKIYQEYESRLKANYEIDFEDQINRACDYLSNSQYSHPYKYILVDEFQDISQDRKRLIDALLNQSEEAKLFAVGDDWQSIYRFSGADIDIMTHFSDHFGVTSQNYLTQTSEIQITRSNLCPECETGELRRRTEKYGAFWGCSNYPKCDYTTPVICPECGKGKLVIKQSQYGAFLSCSKFPRCRYTENIRQ